MGFWLSHHDECPSLNFVSWASSSHTPTLLLSFFIIIFPWKIRSYFPSYAIHFHHPHFSFTVINEIFLFQCTVSKFEILIIYLIVVKMLLYELDLFFSRVNHLSSNDLQGSCTMKSLLICCHYVFQAALFTCGSVRMTHCVIQSLIVLHASPPKHAYTVHTTHCSR